MSSPTAAANDLLPDSDQHVGSHAYHFDPAQSPAEKKAEALKALPSGAKISKTNRGQELISDQAEGVEVDLPLPSSVVVEDTSQIKSVDSRAARVAAERSAKIGWEQVGGSDRASYYALQREEDNQFMSESDRMREHQTWVEQNAPTSTYGEWYHNAAVIVFVALFSWICGKLSLGLIYVLIIIAVAGTHYRTSIRVVRRNIRDDVQRLLAKQKLETEVETAEWINSFLTKFWVIYEPVLAATIVGSVDAVLSTSTPPYLESMRLAEFTLGNKPPRIEHVKTYPRVEEDIVLMDWKFSFTPNDVEDLTTRQIKNKTNPKVDLAVRMGIGILAGDWNILVENLAFAGLMQVKIKLMPNFPHVKVVDLSFLQSPSIDFSLNAIGFDIKIIPGIQGFIKDTINSILGPMMYSPNVFSLNIEQMMSGAPIDSAIGVAYITIHSCTGLRNADKGLGGDKPDPYVKLSLGTGGVEIFRTQTVKNSHNPNFNETHPVLITTLNDPLLLEIFDFNEVRKDKILGSITFDLKQLQENPSHEHISAQVISHGKARGELQFSVQWYSVLQAPKLEDGSQGEVPESNQGILRYTITQAKELDSVANKCNPRAVIFLNNKVKAGESKKIKHTLNPVFDYSKELLITSRSSAIVGLKIMNDSESLGSHNIKVDDLLSRISEGQDSFPLQYGKTGKVFLNAVWKPLNMAGMSFIKNYQDPIGVLRVHCKRAKDVRNVEMGVTGGKSDPYVRVLVSGAQKARTIVFRNDLNPVWDEVLYVPIRNKGERVILEVMDYQARTKDRSLGWTKIELVTHVRQDAEGRYQISDCRDAELISGLENQRGEVRGSLIYTLSFWPTIPVMSPEEEEEEEAAAQNKALEQKKQLEQVPQVSQMLEPANSPIHVTGDEIETRSPESVNREFGTDKKKKMRMSKDDLLKYNSGFLVFDILEGQMAHSGAYLQILFDDYLYPAHTTKKAASKNAKWHEHGEGFIRELDFSQVTVRLNEEEHGEKEDDVVASEQSQTLSLLRRNFGDVSTLPLNGKDGAVNKISFKLRFIPVPMQLDPSESVNNMGKLVVTLVSASNLPAADKNGKSDPYVKFRMNDVEVFKSSTVKKNLNPQWNERFDCHVPSRLTSVFKLECYDWDIAGGDDKLGNALIPLVDLEPMRASILDIPLDGKSGIVRITVLFEPQFVIRTKRGATTRSFTMVPVKGVGMVGGAAVGVGGAALSGVRKTGTFIGRLGRKPNSEVVLGDEPSLEAITTENPTTEAQSAAYTPQKHISTVDSGSPYSGIAIPPIPISTSTSLQGATQPDMGNLKLSVLAGAGFKKDKIQVRVKVRGREILKTDASKGPSPTWKDEECKAFVSLSDEISFLIREHRSFGPSHDIGETKITLESARKAPQSRIINFDSGETITIEYSFSASDASSLKSSRRNPFGLHTRQPSSRISPDGV